MAINPLTGKDDSLDTNNLALAKPISPTTGPLSTVDTGVVSPKLNTTPGEFSGKAATPTPTGILGAVNTVESGIKSAVNAIPWAVSSVFNAVTPNTTSVPTPTPAPTGTPIQTSAPDQTKPHSAGDVWNGTDWTLPGSTASNANVPQNADAESVIKSIDPANQLTDDEKNVIRSGIANGTIKAGMAGAQISLQSAQAALDAYRAQRDTTNSIARNQQVAAQNTQMAQNQYNEALASQKAKMAADQNAMAYQMESAGRLDSSAMHQGINDLMQRNQDTYNRMVSSKDTTVKGIADQLSYQTQVLSNAYNDKVSDTQQTLLRQVQAMNSTGQMDTPQGLITARSYLDKTLSDYAQHQSIYYQQLSTLNDMYEKRHTEALTAQTVDPTVTNSHNDEYMYNQYGQHVVDNTTWLPMKRNITAGQFLKTVTLADGTQENVYYNPVTGKQTIDTLGGTGYKPEIVWTHTDNAGNVTNIIQNSDGSFSSQVVAGAGASTLPKEVMVRDEYGAEHPYVFDPTKPQGQQFTPWTMAGGSTGTPSTWVNMAPWATTNNLGQTDLSSLYDHKNGPAFANNNPWNITDTAFGGTAGGVGGFTKYDTAEEGVQALMNKLEYNKANGVNGVKNGSAYNGNMTLSAYFAQYAPKADGNDPVAYAHAVAAGAGVTVNTQIKDVDTQDLAIGIMQHENGAYYKELVKAGIAGPEGLNLQANAPTPTEPGSVGDNFIQQIKSGNASINGQKIPAFVASAADSVKPGEAQNQFNDSQITQLRGLLVRNGNGMFQIKNEVMAAKIITGDSNPATSLPKLQQMMTDYGNNPEFTTNEQKTIKSVLNGDQAYSATNDKQGYILNAIHDAATKAGVSWTQSDYKNENSTKLAFTVGKYGQQIAAANTALQHLADYKEALAANGNTQIPRINAIMNSFKGATGMSGPTALRVIANTVGDELAGAYNINTEGGKEVKAADFQAALSPDQGAAAVDTQTELMKQRLKSVNDSQWKPIMKTDNPQIMGILGQGGTTGGSTTAPSGKTYNLDDVRKMLNK